jgi:hypothetical protein
MFRQLDDRMFIKQIAHPIVVNQTYVPPEERAVQNPLERLKSNTITKSVLIDKKNN